MKILFFTRIENDTGGDQTLLYMVADSITSELPDNYISSLILAHDTDSRTRAQRISSNWPRGDVWFNPRNNAGGAALDRSITPSAMTSDSWEKLTQFIQNDEEGEKLDIFVVAGWPHQMNRNDALYMRDILRIPRSTKIVLCAPPGKKINEGFYTELSNNYSNIYGLQPGLEPDECGFPMPLGLDKEYMISAECRREWVDHITSALSATTNARPLPLNEDAIEQRDNLIVIYCSKDKPGDSGNNFLRQIQENVGDLSDYSVVFIGANASNLEDWMRRCTQYGIAPNQIITAGRTDRTEILMRGLRDAKFSMATGSFSILEAKNLGITHCKYLCPSHLKKFGGQLDSVTTEHFEKGKLALNEVSNIWRPTFQPVILRASTNYHSEKHTESKDDGGRDNEDQHAKQVPSNTSHIVPEFKNSLNSRKKSASTANIDGLQELKKTVDDPSFRS